MARPPIPGLRERILEAALAAFTKRGYHGVSVREVATAAGTNVSNLYAHFGSKEQLFRTLLETYEERYFAPSNPLSLAFARFRLPESLEELGHACGKTVSDFAPYFKLIYVDVVEFDGRHIARLFGGMRERYEASLGPYLRELQARGELVPGDPVLGLMALVLSYVNYFTVERLFGVHAHFGVTDEDAVRGIAAIFARGLMGGSEKEPAASRAESPRKKSARRTPAAPSKPRRSPAARTRKSSPT